MIFLGIPTTHSKMEMRNFNCSAKTFHSVIIMGKWAMKKTMRLITSTHSTTKLILYLFIFFSHYFLHLTYSNPLSCACNPLFHFNSSFFFKYFILFYFFISKFNFPKFQPSNLIFFFKFHLQNSNFQNSILKINFQDSNFPKFHRLKCRRV